MAKYKTTITKKDGSTASGYIENDRGYYDDGSSMNAGDSIVDASNKVWTKYGNSGSGSGSGSNGGTGGTGGTGNGAGNPNNSDSGNGSPSYNDVLANNGIPTSSSRGSYRVSSIDRPERTGYLRSARELGELYDIDYDMAAIRGIYDDATNAKYALLSKELKQGENDFYTNNAQANATLLDTLKKATSSAIATGASRGLASAEQLGLMMEQQQAITDEATNLAQERANMADEIAAEKAENIIKAMEYSNSLKQGLATNSTNIYSADTQYDVGLLDWAAQMKNVEALFDQIAAEKETNAAAQALQRELALLEDARLRDEGAANRLSNEKIAADNAAAQQAYYNYMMKNAGSGGSYGSGSGSGYTQYTWEDDVYAARKIASEAYAAGDKQLYIAARRQLTNETTEEIKKDIESDPNFKNSKAWKEKQKKTVEKQAPKITPTIRGNFDFDTSDPSKRLA